MLETISKRRFIDNLRKRKLENLSVIKQIEKTLLKQRGYIFRMPKRGSSVILLLSGGLDSIICWGILMEELGLHVYPLSFDLGEKRARKEEKSINYYSKFYQDRYNGLYHPPIRLSLGGKNISIPMEEAIRKLHPEIIVNSFTGSDKLSDINVSFGTFLLLPVYAKLYAEFLRHTENLYIRNIFCAVTARDGFGVAHQTFTSLRSVMHYLCATSGDFSWQFTSVIFEKETGLYFDKSNLVQWARSHNISLGKTWSCYYSKRYQCGGSDCVACLARREAFTQVGMTDETVYKSIADQALFQTINYKIRSLRNKFMIT